jgi:hypothetical protein
LIIVCIFTKWSKSFATHPLVNNFSGRQREWSANLSFFLPNIAVPNSSGNIQPRHLWRIPLFVKFLGDSDTALFGNQNVRFALSSLCLPLSTASEMVYNDKCTLDSLFLILLRNYCTFCAQKLKNLGLSL